RVLAGSASRTRTEQTALTTRAGAGGGVCTKYAFPPQPRHAAFAPAASLRPFVPRVSCTAHALLRSAEGRLHSRRIVQDGGCLPPAEHSATADEGGSNAQA